ncbi:MAG: ATP-binding protein [Burkholderiales bacterium]|nr:ATP-binding protein [Burkholderiales bacterium]
MTCIALLGAECTGKSTLTQALAARGEVTVSEYLREWCLREGRTPRREEQAAIAQEQQRRIDAAAASGAPRVIADTTALMTALYSRHYFKDDSLLPFALQAQRRCALTVLCCPEGLPWQSDGFLRDGEATRLRIHAELQQLLDREGLAYDVLNGNFAARLERLDRLLAG